MSEPEKRCPHGYIAWMSYCNHCLRSELEQATAELNAKDARIAEQTSAAIGLAAVIEMERARAEQAEAQLAEYKGHMERAGMYGNAGRYWEGRWRDEHTGAAALHVQLAEAKSALSAMEAKQGSLAQRAIDATFWANQTGDKLAAANARIASLEKSMTVLREALEPFVKSAPRYDKCADHRPLMYSWTDGETLTVGDLRKARAALA